MIQQTVSKPVFEPVKVIAYSAKLVVIFAVLFFCIFSIAFKPITDLEKSWYFSTITFILGIYTSNVVIPQNNHFKKSAVTSTTRSTPVSTPNNTAANSMPDLVYTNPPTPEHQVINIIDPKDHPVISTTDQGKTK